MKGMICLQNRFHFLIPYSLIIFFSCSVATQHVLNTSFTSSAITCLPHQRSALLQLKKDFAFEKHNLTDFIGLYDFIDSYSYPKMKFWKEGKDCCGWDGVTCNKETGQVVRLDLSSSWLRGPLSSNSSLFRLRQLERLNLAFNNFTFSQIPSSFALLSRLTHLNLSVSFFSGYVPSEIARLTNLVSLDLSSVSIYNYDDYEFRKSILYLRTTTLIQNMTKLRELNLNQVNLSSPVPQPLANLSSLTSLSLSGCNLYGEFPNNIFQLPDIQVIDVSDNTDLTGFLPNFHSGSKLKTLSLYSTSFSGRLPDSIGSLRSLNKLDISYSNFSGTIPSSVGNLSQLQYLWLLRNNLTGRLPSTLKNLAKLTSLVIGDTGFTGELPFWLGNLRQLQILYIGGNRFNGQIPSSLGNLSQLQGLELQEESLDGKLSLLRIYDTSLSESIPTSLFAMYYLTNIQLDYNQFTGPLEIQNISSSPLMSLSLSGNNLNGQIPLSVSEFPNLERLAQSCP